MTYEATTAFRLTPHLRYAMRVPGGIYNTTWYVVANEAAWRKISARGTGPPSRPSRARPWADLVGRAWNDADARGPRGDPRGGHRHLRRAAPPCSTPIRFLAQEHEARWTGRVATRGYDGRAALAALRRDTGAGR